MDHDQIQRALADLEKRVRALEKLEEKKWRSAFDEAFREVVETCVTLQRVGWCECGRDVCRRPDCPSFKKERA